MDRVLWCYGSSGKEGTYPDLEACAENQLASLDPGKLVLTLLHLQCLVFIFLPIVP